MIPDRRAVIMSAMPAALCCLVAIIAAPASAAPPVNAADLYRQAFAWWEEAVSGDDPILSKEEEFALSDPVRGAPNHFQQSGYAKIGPYLELVRSAAALQACDWGIGGSEDLTILYAHLAPLRCASRMLHFDASVRMYAGDTSGAVDSLAAMSGLADHARRDGVIVSSLVCGAISMFQDRTIEQFFSVIDSVDDPEAVRLLEALSRLDPGDPMGLADSMAAEHELALRMIERLFAADDDSEIELYLGMELLPEFGDELTPDVKRAELEQLDAAYAAFERIVGMEDREAALVELDALSAGIDEGERGTLARLLLPAFERIIRNNHGLADMQAEHRATLIGLRDGTVDLSRWSNAAVAYQRIAELALLLPADRQGRIEAVRVADAALDEASREEVRVLIAPLRERFAREFARAARCRRCDFDAVRILGPVLLPDYARGLRGALRIQIADALLASPSPDSPNSDERASGGDHPPPTPEEALTAALVAVGHLASDPKSGHSLVALSLLEETADATEEFLRRGLLDEASVARLGERTASLPRDDLLGFRAAAARDRERVLEALGWSWSSGDRYRLTEEHFTRRNPDLAGWLLLLQCMGELRRVRPPGEVPPKHRLDAEHTHPLTGCTDFFSAEAMEAAVAAALRLTEQIEAIGHDDEFDAAAWNRLLTAFSAERPIDVSTRGLAAPAAITRLDDLLPRTSPPSEPPSEP